MRQAHTSDGGLFLPLGGLVFGLLGLLWLTGALSAALFGAGWTPLGISDLSATAIRLAAHLGDPRLAWPREFRHALPGALGFYVTLAVILAVALLVVGLIGRLLPEGISSTVLSPNQDRPASARWAGRSDLRALRVKGAEPGRLTLGRHGRQLLAAEARQSVVVVAPSQSWKTTGLAVPALLEWAGPAIATSVKTDLLRDTLERRRQLGEVMIFDPAQVTQMTEHIVRATPLTSCDSWRGALRVAHWLATAARPVGGGLKDADFWYAAAEKLLAPLLFVAARDAKLMMSDVVRFLDEGQLAEEEVNELLATADVRRATQAWRATWNREERARSSIYTTAETILAAFADPRVVEASSGADYTPERLLDGRPNTLYLCAPAHEQQRLQPLFSMMVRELLAVVYEKAAATGKPIDPPLLLVLDEAANIAPIPNLDEVASTGAGQGIQLLSVFQDLAQVRSRYGERAQTIINNHRAKVFGTGISDPETLSYVTRVVGAGEFQQRSETAGELGRSSTTEATTYRELTPANVVRQAQPGTGLLVYGHLPPAKIRLRPWYRDRDLRSLAEGRRPTLAPEAIGAPGR